ncbi:MAG TPA: sigma-70 family RNA polymerase sigma factor [Solirubrobacteraceae bacterium]|nr:sigma-70 family RNA polymerase sigma factor [Solirubrobacteraceae bacterium]
MEPPSDDQLLAAAASDAEAFTAFYRRYERPVLAYFLRRTRDGELAADLTAEVFAAVLLACGRYRPGGAPAAAWLFGIAEHKLVSSLRRRRVADSARQRLGMGPLVITDEDLERIEAFGERGAVLSMLEELPAGQREAVTARVLEERGYEEIAAELRCSPAVVRKRVSRGLAALREQLGSRGEARA